MAEVIVHLRGLRLPDQDDWETMPAGHWVAATCAEYSAALVAAGGLESLTVWSTLTDPSGTYGTPCVYTCWGHRSTADGPVAAAANSEFGSKPCTDDHAVFVLSTDTKEGNA